MRNRSALLTLLAVLCLAACTTVPERPPVDEPPEEPPSRVQTPAIDEAPLRSVLNYYGANARSPAPLPREKPLPADPKLRVQQAIQLGQARPPELQRALNLLDSVLRSNHPMAVQLAPLVRVLHEQYGERLRLESQAREAQRRSDQLQEKIDALTAIERTLPARALPARPTKTLPESPK